MHDVYFLVNLIAAGASTCAVGMLCLVLRKQIFMYRALEARADRIEGRALDNLYSQLEALGNLYRDLNLKSSLPKTRGWAACPDFLHIIARNALNTQPEITVECSSGASTIVLAQCMALNGCGHVYSLEHDPAYAEKTKEHLIRLGLQGFVTLLDAPLKIYVIGGREYRWYDLSCLNVSHIDMLVIDGPPLDTCKMARYPAGPLLFGRLTEGAYVFLDDATRDDEMVMVDLWCREEPVSIVERLLRTEKGCAILAKTAGERQGI